MGGTFKALFSKENQYGFGLDTLNIFGVDKSRDAFTLPGNTAKKDREFATAEEKASQAKAIADAEAAKKTSASQARNAILKRQRAMTNTIYTSPLGIKEAANTARKTLLGQ